LLPCGHMWVGMNRFILWLDIWLVPNFKKIAIVYVCSKLLQLDSNLFTCTWMDEAKIHNRYFHIENWYYVWKAISRVNLHLKDKYFRSPSPIKCCNPSNLRPALNCSNRWTQQIDVHNPLQYFFWTWHCQHALVSTMHIPSHAIKVQHV
jgi:hypothetical protein